MRAEKSNAERYATHFLRSIFLRLMTSYLSKQNQQKQAVPWTAEKDRECDSGSAIRMRQEHVG